ncbi:S-adenosylmethionine-dependent methyltransferase [Savitreella phatthalungensis]
MLPTPDTSHVTGKDVYEPAEDSYALLDALEADRDWLVGRFTTPLLIDLGCGSGIAGAFLGSHFFPGGLAFAIDINVLACEVSALTLRKARLTVATDVLQADLLSTVRDKSVDILLFNPPYVPTEVAEIYRDGDRNPLRAAWAGGQDGLWHVWQVVEELNRILTANGVAYLVLVARNRPIEFMAQCGMSAEIVLKRKAGREHLHILRLMR